MLTSPEQEKIGRDNFNEIVGSLPSRRDFIAGAAAAGTGLGALYFGYEKLKGDPVRVAFIGTGDEGNVLINEHPTDYMKIVAIADLRPSNILRTFHRQPSSRSTRAERRSGYRCGRRGEDVCRSPGTIEGQGRAWT